MLMDKWDVFYIVGQIFIYRFDVYCVQTEQKKITYVS